MPSFWAFPHPPRATPQKPPRAPRCNPKTWPQLPRSRLRFWKSSPISTSLGSRGLTCCLVRTFRLKSGRPFNPFTPRTEFSNTKTAFSRDAFPPETIQIQTEVPHLRTGGLIAGGGFVLLSLLALAGCHVAPPAGGIRVGRRSAIVIWDVIIIAVGVPFSLWFLDMVYAHVFQTAPEWKEDITWGMGFFMVVLANPALAFVTTALSLQTLWITRESIVQKGLFGSSSVAWADLEGIAVAHAFTPRKAGGVLAPHRAMKMLVIHGGGSTLRILEPPYASTKKLILETLAEQAPDEWKERIATAGKEWLSKW